MEKYINKLKQGRFIFLGFFVPLCVWLFVCIVMGITPFGPFSLLVSDLDGGYIDALTNLRRIMLHRESLAYSWGQIQGSAPFAALGLGTLVSTFNFLVCLFPENQILTALTWIVILRIACCGGTFAFYLSKTFKRNDLSISIFAWCYALMSFAVVYYFHIIWLDQIMMLPLVLWGVEKILKRSNDYLFFTMTLTITFLMNFYMAYMTGIFAFLYFIYRYLSENDTYKIKDFLKKMFSFLISPILALGCSAILLLPIFSLVSSRDGLFDSSQMTMSLRYEFAGLLSKLCIGSFDTVLPGGLPYIYCGVIVIILMCFYFISYHISYKEKLLTFMLALFMFLSLTINPLYVAWHGFKPPVYFEGRFAYIVCFLMIFIAYKGFYVINTISDKQIHYVFGIMSIAVLLINRQVYSYISDASILYTVAFLLLYYLFFMLIRKKPAYKKQMLLFMALLVGIEMGNNCIMTIQILDKNTKLPLTVTYYSAYNTIKNDVEEIQNRDSDFYRIEKDKDRSMNDGFGIGYPSIGHFDSIYNYEVKETIGKWGIQTGHNWIRYIGATAITDLLMNIKYTIIQDKSYQSYEKVKENEFATIYKNPYSVSVGFMMKGPLNQSFNASNPLALQSEVLNQMLGENENYFLPLEIEKQQLENVKVTERESNIEGIQAEGKEAEKEKLSVFYRQDDYQDGKIIYHVTSAIDGPCYMYIDQRNYGKMMINIKDKEINPEFEHGNRTIYLGDFKKNERFDVEIKLIDKEFVLKSIQFYELNTEMLLNTSSKLQKEALKITNYTETQLNGTIKVEKERPYLYLSIPFDKGWIFNVDGNKTSTQKVMNGFLGAKLEPGEHTISLSYTPCGFKTGAALSGICWGIVLLIALKRLKEKAFRVQKIDNK